MTQVRDFRNLHYGSIIPTDIDCLIDYHGLGFIFIETKYKSAKLPDAQRLAFERICDSESKPTIFIISSHSSGGDIDVCNTLVTEVRFQRKWHKLPPGVTAQELKNRFILWLDSHREY